jgi:hypothetical protein
MRRSSWLELVLFAFASGLLLGGLYGHFQDGVPWSQDSRTYARSHHVLIRLGLEPRFAAGFGFGFLALLAWLRLMRSGTLRGFARR